MKKLILIVAGLSPLLCGCATMRDSAGQVGSGATSTATSSSSDAVNSKVGDATTSLWQRLFGHH